MATPIHANGVTPEVYGRAAVGKYISTQYDALGFIGMLGIVGGASGDFTRPDTATMIGKQLEAGEVMGLANAQGYNGFFQTGAVGSGGYQSFGGSDLTASGSRSDEVKKGFHVMTCKYDRFVDIEKHVVDSFNKGGGEGAVKIGDAVKRASDEVMEETFAQLGDDIINDSPGDQTAKLWDGCHGVLDWIDNSSTVGGVDRSLAANANFRAQEAATGQTANLSFLRNAWSLGVSQQGGGTTAALRTKRNRKPLACCSPDVYEKLRTEAYNTGTELKRDAGDSMLKSINVGFTGEYFMLDHMTITVEDNLAAQSLFIVDASKYTVAFVPGKKFSLGKFTDLSEALPGTGQDNVYRARLETQFLTINHAPATSFKATGLVV